MPPSMAITAPDGRREATAEAERDPLDPRPAEVHVLALDDDPDQLYHISTELERHGMKCDTAATLAEFREALSGGDYEVVSVDWELEHPGQGAKALELLAQDAEVGKVIFSKHANTPVVRDEAEDYGVDFVELKLFNTEALVRAVFEAARLCYFRRVRAALRRLGRQPDVAAEGRAGELAVKDERMLYAQARDVLIASFWAGEEDKGLMNLAKRRGALPRFKPGSFVKKPFHAKLAELLGYVEMTPAALARILEVDADLAELIVKGEEPPPLDIQTRRHLHWLGSILSYVLDVSKDEPFRIPAIWDAKNRHAGSSDPPPWDSLGLHRYLESEGREGIAQALTWIRKY